MNITLERINDHVHFQAKNPQNNTIDLDGSPAIGGVDAGFRPMELVLAGLAGCSLMDLVSILKKSRQDLRDINVEVTAERADVIPAVFTEITLHYKLYGKLDREKVERTLDLAVNKYCSVGAMIGKTAEIKYTFEIFD